MISKFFTIITTYLKWYGVILLAASRTYYIRCFRYDVSYSFFLGWVDSFCFSFNTYGHLLSQLIVILLFYDALTSTSFLRLPRILFLACYSSVAVFLLIFFILCIAVVWCYVNVTLALSYSMLRSALSSTACYLFYSSLPFFSEWHSMKLYLCDSVHAISCTSWASGQFPS